MGDVIERLLEVEQQARRVIADAERQAAKTVDRARDEARTVLEQGRIAARRQADELLASGIKSLEDERRCTVEAARAGRPSPESLPEDAIRDAARSVVSVIVYGVAPGADGANQ